MKSQKTSIDRRLLVPIVADGAIAGPVADGRLIPVLILDTHARPDVAEAIRLHRHFPQGGDATSQWGSSRDDDDRVMLDLQFEAPVEVRLVIPFSIETQGILVDSIVSTGAVYLQAGQPGDRLREKMFAPRVLVEIPETGFQPEWERLFLRRMTHVIARLAGMGRRRALPLAQKFIAELRVGMALRLQPTTLRRQADPPR